jgi:hypothetical protein
MLSKLVSQVVVFGTPLIMVCLFIAFIGLFIYFNRRIDRVVDRVNTLSELVSVLQDLVNTRPPQQLPPQPQSQTQPESQPEPVENKIVHVQSAAGEKIIVSDDEDDYVSSSEEGDSEDEAVMIEDAEVEGEDEEPLITVTKMEHSPEPEPEFSEAVDINDEEPATCNDDVCEIKPTIEVGLVDDDLISVVSMSVPTVIPEPQLEEICTNAVLKEKFLSTNYRGYKVNQLRDLATELHLINDKEASKLKKGELLTFLDKTYVGLKN